MPSTSRAVTRTDAVFRGTSHSLDSTYYAVFLENTMLQMKTSA